jgi:hypothetical protein
MPSRPLALVLLLASIPTAAVVGAAIALDRVVAVVDDDPILASDLEPPIALGLVAREPGEGDDALHRRVLDSLIAERLRYHEVARFGGISTLPVAEVDAQVAAIRQRFADAAGAVPAAFDAELARLGMTGESLRQLVARQLMVLTYVEERLGPRVFVTLDEIRAYYEHTLKPELEAQKKNVPAVEAVREQIRVVLKQQRLNEEVTRWTEELRRQADVIDSLASGGTPLPPVVGKP